MGQFQAQRIDNITTNSIAHYDIHTPSKSEINTTITENIVPHNTSTSSQREIFSETGTDTSSSKDMSHSDEDIPEEQPQCTGSQSEHEETSDSSGTSTTTMSSQSEIFSGYNNNSDCETYTSSQSKITTDYDANSESSSRETLRPSSPESGNLTTRTLYSPTPEMAIIQQKAIAASKLQCNIQIKRTSTPDPSFHEQCPSETSKS